jgi:hypothetical protein
VESGLAIMWEWGGDLCKLEFEAIKFQILFIPTWRQLSELVIKMVVDKEDAQQQQQKYNQCHFRRLKNVLLNKVIHF